MKRTSSRALAAAAAATAMFLAACGGGSGDGGDGGDAGSGETITLNLATMVQETTPHFPVISWFFDELEARSDGRIIVERTAPESVCKAPEIAECVRDGRADIGVTIPDYTPQLFPTTSAYFCDWASASSTEICPAIAALICWLTRVPRSWNSGMARNWMPVYGTGFSVGFD